LAPVKLEGIDDPLLYLADVQAFGDLVKVGPAAAREWKSLKGLLLPGAAPELRHHLELVEKLLELKLLDHEWLQYKRHRDWTPARIASSEQQASELGKAVPRSRLAARRSLSLAIAAAERFYTAAEARNGVMAANLLAHIGERGSEGAREQGSKGAGEQGSEGAREQRSERDPFSPAHPLPRSPAPVVLVTGGFHTASIA